MADDIVVNIAFKGNANEFLAELSRSVGRAKQQLQEMGQSTAALSRLETQLAKMAGTTTAMASATNKAAQATQGWAQKWTPFKGAFQQTEASSKSLWRSIDTGIQASEKSIGRATTMLAQFDQQQRNAAMHRATGNPMADWDKAFASASKAADANVAAMKRAQQAVEQYQNSLSNTRYVLYDVAGTLSIMGIALVAPIASIVNVAVQFEKAFAQVERTSGATGNALKGLKEDFDDLYGSIPITYEALAQIATLGGQLGVPMADLAEFTEIVAKTSAVTNLTVDQAATAFGRLNAIIPNIKGQYERLGSSIALVGVNSVATESEIVNIATQISSMGTFAGLTAQDIIGLSGALASIGAQPELSRGTLTRVFSLMSAAVSASGEDLDKFARIAGVSSETFKQAWGKPEFANVFLGFMKGIHGEGKNAISALHDLGITSVRDVPLLMRLAGAADSTGKSAGLLAQTVGDANRGWAENIELQRQFEIIAGTVSARFDVLVNNLNLLLQAIGAPMLQGLGEFISFLTEVVEHVTDFAKTDMGGTILRIVTALTALVGVLALAGGAMALMGASSIGLYQALLFVSAQSPRAAAALVGVAGAAGLANGTLKAGAASALLFGRALKAITIVGALLILPELLKGIGSALDDMAGNDFTKVADGISFLAKSTDLWTSIWKNGEGIARNAADFANSLTATGRAVMALDDLFKAMIAGGQVDKLADYLNEFNRQATDMDAGQVASAFSSVLDAAREAGYRVKVTGDEIQITGNKSAIAAAQAGEMGGSVEALAAEAEAATEMLDQMKDALDAIGGAQMSASAASDMLQSAINQATEAVKQEGVTLEGTNDASIGFRDNLRDIEQKARDAATALAENGGSMDAVVGKWNTGRESIINMLTAFLGSRDAAVAWADANLGASNEIIGGLQALTSTLNGVPKNPEINMTANTDEATTAIEEFMGVAKAQTVTTPFYANTTPADDTMGAFLTMAKAQSVTTPVNTNTTPANTTLSNFLGMARSQTITNPVYSNTYPASSTFNNFIWTARNQSVTNPVYANTNPAQSAVNGFIYANNGRTITIYTNSVIRGTYGHTTQYATGGHVRGPGTQTSDDIPAWLSNDEYVLRARAAKAIGYGRLDYMNRTGQIPKFAKGGQVGTTTTSSSNGFSNGEVDLGPRTLRALSRQVVNMIQIDQRAIASAANEGNAQRARRGGGGRSY
jgi:TP901 family phage tail tape measure protein